MRTLTALILLVVPFQSLHAQSPGITVEGKTLTVITELPFKVNAPPGAKLYFWTFPPTWKTDAKAVSTKNSVTVTSAPDGQADVSVTTIDEKFNPVELTLKVNVGTGSNPVPPPTPSDPLVVVLKAAHALETDPARNAQVKALAALYRAWAKAVQETPPPTWGRLFEAMAVSAKTTGVAGKILNVQKALQAELMTRLPLGSNAPLTIDGQALAAATFTRAANCLEEVIK